MCVLKCVFHVCLRNSVVRCQSINIFCIKLSYLFVVLYALLRLIIKLVLNTDIHLKDIKNISSQTGNNKQFLISRIQTDASIV